MQVDAKRRWKREIRSLLDALSKAENLDPNESQCWQALAEFGQIALVYKLQVNWRGGGKLIKMDASGIDFV